MTDPRPLSAVFVLAALAACSPGEGAPSASAPVPKPLPAEQALQAIPLGAPPGDAAPLGASVANPHEGDAAAIAQGKTLFTAMNCVYCHGAEGSGLMGPPLNSRAWRYGGTPAQLFNSVHDGRPKGMPAWGDRLPADQIWDIVAYIESLGGALPPADQVQADTAHQALVEADHQNGP